MTKDAYYFPHDSNAQHDEKILQLRAKHGWEGYGLYWAIIERLRDNEDFKFSLTAIPGLSISLSHPQDSLEAMLEDCFTIGLLHKLDGCFYSDSLMRRMNEIDARREVFRESGRRGGIASSQAKASLKPPSSSKVKESKVNKIKQYNVHEDFESLWNDYPKRVGKKQAVRHFLSSVKTPSDVEDIRTALKNYKVSKAVAGGYIQNGSTWFNNWRDWVVSPEPAPKTGIEAFIKD